MQPSMHLLRFSRRRLLASGAAAGGLASLAPPVRVLASPLPSTGPTAVLAANEVYFEETGHTVAGAFWRLWRTYGLDAFGYPITETFEDGGVLNQYFQRARLEAGPDGVVRLGLLGIEAGGAAPPGGTAPDSLGPDTRLIPETGHTVAGAFLAAYSRWQAVLGPPIGPEQPTGGGYVQYFAHARVEWDPTHGTRLGLLGSELAAQRGLDTTPIAAPPGMVTWREVAAALAADEAERRALGASVSGAMGFVPGSEEKWIAISIARQRITAYEHTQPVFTDLVSTGAAHKGLTPRGIFAINRRIANETMDSTTIGYPRGHPKYYRLENVLYTQYFDNAGTAIHYAWWHNNFGWPMSYGCVNLRLSTARWFWDWATLGTRVVVA